MTPDNYTIQESFLDVGDGHSLYIQDWGNTKAKTPIVFLHGGPGAACKDGHKQLFDPRRQRVIFFDQRGSGKSLPYGSLKNNTTQDLVEDIEKIARHLNLDQVILTGGSWGSCLAFAHALKHPKRVKALVLRGIFTGSKREIEFLDQGHFQNFFPDVWEKYLEATPKAHWQNPSAYHFKNALEEGEKAKASAYAYENVEGALLRLDDRYTPEKYEDYDPAGIRLEIHYLLNNCFIPEGYILDNAQKLKMPVWLIQGRYDVVCPPITAYELSKELPNGELVWVTSGHVGSERAIYDVVRTVLLQLTKDHA